MLAKIFGDFRPGELGRASFLQVQFALIVFCLLLGRTVRDAVFLSRSGIESLPLMYVGVGIVATLATIVYTKLIANKSPSQIAPLVQFFFAGTFAMFAIASSGGGAWLYAGLYLWVEVLTAITAIQFWNIANGQFDPRQAKRLYGFIAAGQALGNILCGVVATGAGRWIQVEELIWLVAAGCAIVGLMYRNSVPNEKTTKPAVSKRQQAARSESEFAFRKYVLLIVGLVAVTYLTTSWVDFQFKVIAKRSMDEAELTRFFGQFYGAVGALSFVVQLFLLRHVTAKLGLFGAIALMPLFFVTLGSILPFAPLLAVATALKFSENGLRYAIYDPLLNTVFLPLPVSMRARIQSLVGGVVKPGSMALAGLLLLPLAPDQPGGIAAEWLGVAIALASAVALTFLYRMRGGYLSALVKQTAAAVETRKLEPIVVGDDVALARLAELVKRGTPQAIDWFLERIEVADRQAWLTILESAQRRDDLPMTLKARVAAKFVDLGGADLTFGIAGEEGDVRLLSLLSRPIRRDNWQKLLPFLEVQSVDIREATLRHLFSSEVPAALLQARDYLVIFSESKSVSDRILACRMAGFLLPEERLRLIGKALSAPEIEIRTAVLEHLCEMAAVEYLPEIVGALDDRRVSLLAVLALAQTGPKGLQALAMAKGSKDFSRSPWRRLGPLWGVYARNAKLNWQQLAATVLIVERDPIYWLPPLLAVAAAGREAALDVELNLLLAKAGAAAERWGQLRRALDKLPADDLSADLLRRAASERLDAALQALMAIAFIWYKPQIDHWERLLRPGLYEDAKLRANLAEIVDQGVQSQDKNELIRLLEFQFQSETDPTAFLDCASPIPQVAATHWPEALDLTEGQMAELVDRVLLINRLLFLNSVPLFQTLRGEDLEQIAEAMEEIEYGPGTTFIRQGDPGDSLYLINKGKVRVHIGQQTLAELQEGAVVGEIALLDDQPRTASVTTIDDVEVLRLDRADFEHLLDAYPQIARGVMKVITKRLRSLTDQVRSS